MNQLRHWRKTAIEQLPSAFDNEQKKIEEVKKDYQKQIEMLYAEVGRLTTELSWVKKKSGLKE